MSKDNKKIKCHNCFLRQITLSSTKERIDGLGFMARNCAFFDIETFFSKSSSFSLVLSAKKMCKKR